MRQSHLIISNAVIMWGAQVLNVVPQVILVPYLIGTIGEVGYGVYALIWPLIMSFDQLEKSSQFGVVKYSAAFFAQGLICEVNKIISTSFVYSIFLAALACIGIIIAGFFYNDPSGQIGFALIVVGIMILFIVPLTPYIAVIMSRQRYYVNAIADTLSKYISLLAVVIWFSMVGPSVEVLIIIMAVTLFLARLAQVPIAYHFVPGLKNNPHFFDKKTFVLIATFGGVMVFISGCTAVNTTGIRWLMDILVSTSFVAHLAIMLMPAMLLSQIIEAMTSTVVPAASAYEATKNQQMLQELLIRGIRYTMILALVGLFAAGFLMRDILNLWVGPKYMFLAPYILVLFVSRSCMLSASTANQILKGMGKLRAVMSIYLIGLVIVPIGMILAIIYIWHDPYIAVSIGLATGYILCGCLQLGFCLITVKADLRSVLTYAYVQPLIFAAPVWLAFFYTITFFGFNSLFIRTIISITSIMLFLGGFYFCFATAEERHHIQFAINKISEFQKINLAHKKK